MVRPDRQRPALSRVAVRRPLASRTLVRASSRGRPLPVVAVLVAALGLTLAIAVATVVAVVLRVRRAYLGAVACLASARPVLDELAERQRVMHDELERLSASRERLRGARRARGHETV